MKKAELIRKIYTIVLSVFIAAVGIAFICVAADIYYSGGAAQGAYSRDIVVEKLTYLAIPFILLLGAVAAGAIFPLIERRVKMSNENALKLTSKKIPTGGDEEFEKADKKFKKFRTGRLVTWCVTGAVILASTIATLCYVFNTAHFLGDDFTDDILVMAKNVLPWIAVTFAVMIAAAVVNGVLSGKQLNEAKTMMKHGNGVAEVRKAKALAAVEKVLSHDITLWVVRGVVLVIVVTFILLGIFNGGARAVMVTATELCKACIGIG